MSIRRGDVDYVEHKTWTCKMISTPQNFVEGSSSTKKEDKRNKTGVNFGLSFPLNMPGIAYLKPWKIEQYYQHDLLSETYLLILIFFLEKFKLTVSHGRSCIK